jgi:murein DD-endopeptidase MepM/ murein hydrolase activator NlpD
MKNAKFYISAALFIAITALKFLSPSLAGDVREKLLPAIEQNTDYRAVMTEIGTTLSDGKSVISALGKFHEDETDRSATSESTEISQYTGLPERRYRPKTVGTLHEKLTRDVALINLTEPSSAEPVQEQPDPEQAQREAAVETFLASQADYSDYAVPANVTYSAPALPFSYQSPVTGYTSSGFGYRIHPLLGEVKFHYGTDFAAWSGTDILAFAAGTVLAAGESDSYGKYIMIDHGDGYETLYAHCSQLNVSAGESVQAGQKIALVGATGQATGPHLHFELLHDNVYLNPEFYLYEA